MKKRRRKKVPLMFLVLHKDGKYRRKNSALIKRFPRVPEGETHIQLGQAERFAKRTESGDIPRGYDVLDKKWKRIAKMVASGESIKDTCKKYGVMIDTFYRRRKAHPMFKAYLKKCFEKAIGNIPNIQNRQVVRAVNIVGEAMESSDPYFRYDVAHKHLRGMGKYSTSQQVKQELSGNVQVTGAIEKSGVDKDLLLTLVQGMVEMSRGKSVSVIDIQPDQKLLNGNTQVQIDNQREAS